MSQPRLDEVLIRDAYEAARERIFRMVHDAVLLEAKIRELRREIQAVRGEVSGGGEVGGSEGVVLSEN